MRQSCLALMLLATWLMACSPAFADSKKADELAPGEAVVIEGDWGFLICKPIFPTFYFPADRDCDIVFLPNGKLDMQYGRKQTICEFTMLDRSGNEVRQIDDATFLIDGKPERATLFSSKQSSIRPISGTECIFDAPGRVFVNVKFAKQVAKFNVNVTRTRLGRNATPAQVVKEFGEPSNRETYIASFGSTFAAETWTWKKHPNLAVMLNTQGKMSVINIESQPIPQGSFFGK